MLIVRSLVEGRVVFRLGIGIADKDVVGQSNEGHVIAGI